MPSVRKNADKTVIEASRYRLIIDHRDPGRVKLASSRSSISMELYVASSCNTVDGIDHAGKTGFPEIHEREGGVLLEFPGRSDIWEAKKYFFTCRDDSVEYHFSVSGARRITNCHFFEGFREARDTDFRDSGWEFYASTNGEYVSRLTEKSGSRTREASIPGFETVFNPEPNHEMKQYFWFGEYSVISACSADKLLGHDYHEGNWQFAPSPFCYAVSDSEQMEWASLGVAVRPGQYNFNAFEYIGGSSFGLNLAYEGHVRVDGNWESPHAVLLFAQDEYDALNCYVTWLEEHGFMEFREKKVADWWRHPIVCGWGQQHYYHNLHWFAPTRPPAGHPSPVDYATQANYERIVEVLEANRLPFNSLVVDDKWQTFYGDPWPDPGKWDDMRVFIDRQHDKGRHVLLWLKAWDCEGVPVEECITRDGQPVAVDPSNPSYELRLRKAIRFMLSSEAGCLNADGFKLDALKSTPTGQDLRSSGPIWGVELLKKLMDIIHEETKGVKSDAMVMAHTANPYFANVVDVLRLNDIHHADEHIVERMTHRARVARIACPHWLIDTDNWPVPNRKTWLTYMRAQPRLGIPSLYFATHLETSREPIQPEDYAELREIWGRYIRDLGKTATAGREGTE